MKDTQRTLRENWHGVLPRIGEVLILATFVLFILFANDVREATVQAFHFSLSVILPSIFPFTVLSGVYTGLQMSTQSMRGRRVARVLGVPKDALGICFLSLLVGFPQSGMLVADLYNEGRIAREDASRIFPMLNNPSVGFVTVGVGLSCFGSIRIGIFLYACVLLCARIVGLFGRGREEVGIARGRAAPSARSLSEIVKEASFTTVAVVGFVVFFTILRAILDRLLLLPSLRLLALLTLEVTGGATGAAIQSGLSLPLRLSLCAFSLGFGGVCVGMQSEIYLRRANLPVRPYYERKLAQGLLCALLVGLLSVFVL